MTNKLYEVNGTKVQVYMLIYECGFPTNEAAEAFVEQSKKDDAQPNPQQGFGRIAVPRENKV